MDNIKNKIRELIQTRLKEDSVTGVGSGYTSGTSGENTATPIAAGKAKVYYYKLGFKPVKTTKPKSFDKKQLWEEEASDFNIESYLDTLPTDDEEIKKYIAGRLGDFDLLSGKLKELIVLLQKAKKETINTYRKNPQFRAIYGTDLAVSLVDDIIKLFK
jgi:hypothetical protein